ncbi:T9SS type A sorting domain-containing protein [Flavobacterium sp.]|uniref:T9SS type A sorting domain-containing protein n=1 Tax=Flavobacterium sp. TaxID=239 RepID=UPI003BBDBD91
MKKLLLLFILSFAFTSQAQDLFFTENCETLTIGNLSTDLTGATPGQGNWYTFTSTTAVPAGTLGDYKVVNDAISNSKVLQITGTSGSAGSRFLSQDVSDAWTGRTSGNDVIQMEYDFFSGSGSTTSLNTFRTYIYNFDPGAPAASATTAVAGFYYNPSTLKLSGWAYYDATATAGGVVGYYTFNLISGGLTLEPNTWYRLGLAYDYNTGDVTWKESTGLFYGGVVAASSGLDITECDFAVSSGSVTGGVQNAASNNYLVDNVQITAVATESLLSVNTNSVVSSDISVFPNPTKDIINVSNKLASISSIEISDLNGRVVNKVNSIDAENVQINISDLSSGIYMMKIVSDKGTITKKVIKE